MISIPLGARLRLISLATTFLWLTRLLISQLLGDIWRAWCDWSTMRGSNLTAACVYKAISSSQHNKCIVPVGPYGHAVHFDCVPSLILSEVRCYEEFESEDKRWSALRLRNLTVTSTKPFNPSSCDSVDSSVAWTSSIRKCKLDWTPCPGTRDPAGTFYLKMVAGKMCIPLKNVARKEPF